MFPVHPYRYFSIGREALGARRKRTPASNCLLHLPGTPEVCKNAQANFGWTQLPMTAALLGDAAVAQRAVQPCLHLTFTPSLLPFLVLPLPFSPTFLAFSLHSGRAEGDGRLGGGLSVHRVRPARAGLRAFGGPVCEHELRAQLDAGAARNWSWICGVPLSRVPARISGLIS